MNPASDESLARFLTARQADRDTIEQAARYAVAELSRDLTPDEMLHELRATLNEPDTAPATVADLTRSPADLTETALWVLTHLWYDLDEREVVAGAVINAQTKLPIIEVAVIATSVLYGLHLIMTRGVKRSTHKVEYRADGSFTETTTLDYQTPPAASRLVAGLRSQDPDQSPEA